MPLSMFMGIQMIRTILIVALTFGAKTKFQIAIQFCTAADGTLMPGGPGPFLYFMPEYLPSADLPGTHLHHIPCGQEKNYQIGRAHV